jgi:hypothetical protein
MIQNEKQKTLRAFIKEYAWLSIPILLFVIIRFGLGFNGLYGQDSHEYLRAANWVGALLHGNHEPASFFWPLGYPLLGSLLSALGVETATALQLISLIAFIGTLFISYKIMLLIHPAFTAYAKLCVLVVLMPATYFLRAAYLGMSDMQACLFVMATFYFTLLFLKKEKPLYVVLAAAMGVLAFFTRYAAGILLFVPAIVLLQRVVKNKKYIALLLSLLVCAALATLFMLLKGDNYHGFTNHLQITGWAFANFFKSSFYTIDGHSQYMVVNLFYALSLFVHPGYLLPGLVLLFFLKRTDFLHPSQMLLFLPIMVYLLFVMGMPFQNMRFLLMAFPLVCIWLFPAFIRAFERIKNNKVLKIVVVCALLLSNLTVLVYSGKNFLMQNRLEREIAGSLISGYAQEIPLYTFSIDPALKSYGVKNPIHNMWEKEYTEFVPGSLVLFNPDKFSVQWKDMNPMKNWNALQTGELVLLKRFPQGWELYEIR